MPPEDELLVQWLARADDDLRLAELALNASPPVCWSAAFHAQQGAEKLLEALLTHHGIEFEKVHSIDYLLEATEIARQVRQFVHARLPAGS